MERKEVPGFPDYEVTKDGRVWSKPRSGTKGGWIVGIPDKDGYLRLGLNKNNKKHMFRVHRLVMLAYVGHSLSLINHKDGNFTNNVWDEDPNKSNLEYAPNRLLTELEIDKRQPSGDPIANIPKKTVGIYRIYRLDSRRSYIGQSTGIRTRLRNHFYTLYNNKHKCKSLQGDYNVIGPKGFAWEILETCNSCDLDRREQKYHNWAKDSNIRLYSDMWTRMNIPISIEPLVKQLVDNYLKEFH